MLSLERFSHVLQAAECSNNSVKLTFVQEVEFDKVHQGWQWIDDAVENYVILVTENDRCNIADGDRNGTTALAYFQELNRNCSVHMIMGQ